MKIRVLFLCVHNSSRSQLAEGLLRQLAGDRFEVYSAGSQPTQLNPFAAQVLIEHGVDPAAHRSKSVNDFIRQPVDYVITLCAEEACPVMPGQVTRLHWALPDPSAVGGTDAEKLAAVRRAAAEIQTRLYEFVESVDKSDRQPA